MKNSLPDPGGIDVSVAPIEMMPSGDLWNRRSSGTSAVAFAAALTGADEAQIANLASISLAASTEAGQLIDDMGHLSRTLTTTVATQSERCVSSVRGPVQWGETITARANALGNEDVFVCTTSGRSFETVENRVLVMALVSIASAGSALVTPAAAMVDPERAALVEQRAQSAQRWLTIPRLKKVPRTRLSSRELAKFRRSRRVSRMRSVTAFGERQLRCLDEFLIRDLCDSWTVDLHRFVVDVISHIEAFDRIPGEMDCSETTISAGRITFRHPAAHGTSVPGLSFRGIPLLPPPGVVAGAPWAGELPARGIRINSPSDIDRLMRHLGMRARQNRH